MSESATCTYQEGITVSNPLDGPKVTEWALGPYIDKDGYTRIGSYTQEDDKEDKKTSEIIAEGHVFIKEMTETYIQNSPVRSFIFRGKTIYQNEPFEFTMSAADASINAKFNATMTNYFGVAKIGSKRNRLTLDMVKAVSSKNQSYIRCYTRPQWKDGKIMAPGLVDARFNFEQRVPVGFGPGGDPTKGVKSLELCLAAWNTSQENVILMINTYFASPIVALLWPNDRYAVSMTGDTGCLKTSFCQYIGCLYGVGFFEDANLISWEQGSTVNGMAHLAACMGIFPQVQDNFKKYTDMSVANAQKLLHAVLEGSEKARMNQDNGMQNSESYDCIPIINGEQFLGSDAATRARIIGINWIKPDDLSKFTEAQKMIEDLNALGREWCQWLSSPSSKESRDKAVADFDEVRSYYLKEADGAINSGRIATNAAIIHLIGDMLLNWPITAEFAEKFAPIMKKAISSHILNSREEVNDNLEGEKFIKWLRGKIELGKYAIRGIQTTDTTVGFSGRSEDIGEYRESKEGNKELLMSGDMLDTVLLPTWQKDTVGSGTRSDAGTLRRQLVSRGYLIKNDKTGKNTHTRMLFKKQQKVLLFSWDKIYPPIEDEGVE